MNLFEPPEHKAPSLSPSAAMPRIAFDVSLGVALGMGAACALFAIAWAGFGAADERSPWLPVAIAGIGLAFALTNQVLRSLAARWPIAGILGVSFRWLSLGAVAVALVWTALVVGQRLSAAVSNEFATLIVLGFVIGVVWLFGLPSAWREVRARVTPWVVAAITLYLAADWSVKLGPTIDGLHDPRIDIALHALIGCGVFAVCGILAVMDRMIAARNRTSEAN